MAFKSSHFEHDDVGQARRRSSMVVAPALPDNTFGTDDEVLRKMSVALPDIATTTESAQTATEFEAQMTVLEGIRLYPKAIMFSCILSLAIIMEGYDTALLGNFYALPQFNQRFGRRLSDGSYQLTSSWQSGLQNGAQVGEIAGLMIAGILADRFGYRKTILGALIMIIGCIFLFFFAQNIGMLFAAEVLAGIPWGAFQTLTTTYAADVTPIALRPLLTTFVNLCWVTGQLIAVGVLRGLLTRPGQWAWRIPYAIQWIWPLPIIVGVFLAPESPWWLVRKGRLEEAKKALLSLTVKSNTNFNVDNTVATMVYTNELEVSVSSGTTYWDCFKGYNLRRTEIACVVWITQVFCGIWFGGNIVYFLEAGGFAANKSFDFGIGETCLGFVGTVVSWFIMPHVGRRRLYLVGLSTMFTILLLIGFMGIPAPQSGLNWASAACLIVFVFVYDLTVGPVCYCLVSEMPSTRLRVKTVVLARNAYNIASIVANFLNPPILNPSAWDLRGKGGFVWCGFCFMSLVWSFFRLPEPKGLSPAELDVLFEQGLRARQFSKVNANPFRSTNLETTQNSSEEDVMYIPEKK
jgi:SP family general alpha glucoside:H+ symporter-like MFS transporter